MKRKYLVILFIIMAIAQASVPLKMVYDSEMTENYGTVYKFKTAPIDPSDPFRGKYISLRYEMNVLTTKDSSWVAGDDIYVGLTKDSAGFAKAAFIAKKPPKKANDYFKAAVTYYNYGSVSITIPFDNFYMEESKALEAETGYRDYSLGQDAKPAYALVALRNGNAVLKDVIIDDIPVKEYVLRERKRHK